MAARRDRQDSISMVERALSDIRRGRMVILTDDEDRENEGDLVMAAEKVTPAAVNFMATHARGLICLSLTDERLRQLNLPLMVQDNTSPYQTAFTVSIEAAHGVTTGISARDRATTIRAAVAPDARPGDPPRAPPPPLGAAGAPEPPPGAPPRPAPTSPRRAREGGVLARTGQPEGSVALARLAGLFPAGVICEVMNPDGTMARRPELTRFARKHELHMLSVADIIRYRLQRERLVKRLDSRTITRAGEGAFTAISYGSDVDPLVHVALVKGDVSGSTPVLTRVHRACLVGDLLGSSGCDCGAQLRQTFARIAQEGRG